MHSVKIQQCPAPIDVGDGTILDAALREGIPYPHSCRAGECGSCKTRLLSGEVEHDPCLVDALSDAERQKGYILACRARPTTNLEIAWLQEVEASAHIPVRKLKATVVGLKQVALDVSRLTLEVSGRPLDFAAGQYARLKIGRLPTRAFSMANRPDENELEFHIRHVPDGLVSGYVAQRLALGDSVRLEGPFGSSYLRESHEGPIVAVGGGTGIAPMMSIVRTALDRLVPRPTHLYFGAQAEADVYVRDELTKLISEFPHIRAHVVLSAPSGATERRVGFVHQALESDLNDLSNAKVYAAGPPPMVSAVTELAISHGLGVADIHCDPFVPSAQGDHDTQRTPVHVILNLLEKVGAVFCATSPTASRR